MSASPDEHRFIDPTSKPRTRGYPHYDVKGKPHHHHLCPTAKTGHDMACVCGFIQEIIEDTLGQCTMQHCGLTRS
jgi:hypothetical protein